jgi:hypothetical protein
MMSPTGVKLLGAMEPFIEDAEHLIAVIIFSAVGQYYCFDCTEEERIAMYEHYNADMAVLNDTYEDFISRGAEPFGIVVQHITPGLFPLQAAPIIPTLPASYPLGQPPLHVDVRHFHQSPRRNVNMYQPDGAWVLTWAESFQRFSIQHPPPPPTEIWIDAQPDLPFDLIEGLHTLITETWDDHYPGIAPPREHHRADQRWVKWCEDAIRMVPVP